MTLVDRIASLLAWILMASASAHAGTAPDFALPVLAGQTTLKLSQLRGKPVLLNFWASNCIPCIKEMPLLDAQSALYPRASFIGIAVDDAHAALDFLRVQPMRYPQLLAGAPAGPLLRRFGNGINGLPYTVVLDTAHRICATRFGQVDAPWIARAMEACATD